MGDGGPPLPQADRQLPALDHVPPTPRRGRLPTMNQKYKGTYLEYHDKRLSKIAQGYIMQGIFYYLTGEPFCNSLECRLYNPHWQKDLLYSQITVGKLCEKHQNILKNF